MQINWSIQTVNMMQMRGKNEHGTHSQEIAKILDKSSCGFVVFWIVDRFEFGISKEISMTTTQNNSNRQQHKLKINGIVIRLIEPHSASMHYLLGDLSQKYRIMVNG